MAHHDLKLSTQKQRDLAHKWIDAAPAGAIVRVFPEPTRTQDQNAKMWPMLFNISLQYEHDGTFHSPETWKILHMHALGHESRFMRGLNNEVFPSGFSSSKLSIKEMSDLIEWMYAWGAENNIKWSDRGFD